MKYKKELEAVKTILSNFGTSFKETFTCEECFEEVPEECMAIDAYEVLGLENICEECYQEALESMRG